MLLPPIAGAGRVKFSFAAYPYLFSTATKQDYLVRAYKILQAEAFGRALLKQPPPAAPSRAAGPRQPQNSHTGATQATPPAPQPPTAANGTAPQISASATSAAGNTEALPTAGRAGPTPDATTETSTADSAAGALLTAAGASTAFNSTSGATGASPQPCSSSSAVDTAARDPRSSTAPPIASAANPSCPYLVLHVRRPPLLVRDTLQQLLRVLETDPGTLSQPLKVKFLGELGHDEGGVQNEFFSLLARELFSPANGMFTYNEDTRLYWFCPDAALNTLEFELVGLVVGLCLYNGATMDLRLPQLAYEALLRPDPASPTDAAAPLLPGAERATCKPPPLQPTAFPGQGYKRFSTKPAPAAAPIPDSGQQPAESATAPSHDPLLLKLRAVFPSVHASLQRLMEHEDGDVAELGLMHEVDLPTSCGKSKSVELLPGGGAIPVNDANKREFANLYARLLLQDSVAPQMASFAAGFQKVAGCPEVFHFFTPADLEQLLCGSQALDLCALERAAKYEDGFTKSSQEIKWFWQVLGQLDETQKRRFLFFLTGSDRAPINGLEDLRPPLVISRQGMESDRLPTAHTCFNHLLLPGYTSKEALRRSLMVVIENAEGFGIM